jgi:hypothetical protein
MRQSTGGVMSSGSMESVSVSREARMVWILLVKNSLNSEANCLLESVDGSGDCRSW